MNFSQTQIELDITTFAISQKCEFPAMYRKLGNPSLASLASLRSIWVLLKLPAHHLRILFHHSLHCSTVRTYHNYSASNPDLFGTSLKFSHPEFWLKEAQSVIRNGAASLPVPGSRQCVLCACTPARAL